MTRRAGETGQGGFGIRVIAANLTILANGRNVCTAAGFLAYEFSSSDVQTYS